MPHDVRLDPVLAERLPLLDGLGRTELPRPAEELARLAAWSAPVPGYAPPAVPTEDRRVEGPHGDVPVRVYRPVDAAGAPTPPVRGVVWLHGGGFAAGTLDWPEGDVVARELCARAGAVVVSVDYRLASDTVAFPVPHDDVHAAWSWAVDPASGLAPGGTRWSLGGASAGGNLALGVAQRLRDEAGGAPAALLLAYPWLHDVLPEPGPDLAAALAALPDVLRFTPEQCRDMNDRYLGGHPATTPYAMPALGEVGGLPPALVVLDEHDDLRPSGELVAAAMAEAGGEVEVVVEPGTPHGHLNVAGLPAALDSLGRCAAFLVARA
ncbi:alpha/beta hydrolase fold domain-containing protein [Cellulomonas endophytica]|uniref:alpha/beta hydrolase fold domain-containing protein n=1 Tax=Cellulomonas endophytica TaxID=2494735 RepID=UPI0013E93562|nr:alpha/beta hydrolase fold domain-containing protein [Cellulomonas endophytica]